MIGTLSPSSSARIGALPSTYCAGPLFLSEHKKAVPNSCHMATPSTSLDDALLPLPPFEEVRVARRRRLHLSVRTRPSVCGSGVDGVARRRREVDCVVVPRGGGARRAQTLRHPPRRVCRPPVGVRVAGDDQAGREGGAEASHRLRVVGIGRRRDVRCHHRQEAGPSGGGVPEADSVRAGRLLRRVKHASFLLVLHAPEHTHTPFPNTPPFPCEHGGQKKF